MEESWHTIINPSTTLFWFRRDLRLEDNAGLCRALKERSNVLPIFIFDTDILTDLESRDARVTFIYDTIMDLKADLEKFGSSLLMIRGKPLDFFREANPAAVYTNDDYEPYARIRDEKVMKVLNGKGISFYTFKDHVIFEKDEVVKDNGEPYTVFTPYSKKWKGQLKASHLAKFPTLKYTTSLKQLPVLKGLSLTDIGFKRPTIDIPPPLIKASIIGHYDKTRDIPGIQGTTRLGIHLRFGTISIRQVAKIALEKNETWLNELIWREFYQMIIWHFPQVIKSCFKSEYDHIAWRNIEEDFTRWSSGTTGFPLVDAGMRELNTSGFMHNRVRMVTASFLTKHLLIDWRWGEAYFAKKLLDYELASNNGNWQWAAGCGCDAAPYFRVFNPTLQLQKFDSDHRYIRQWIPEYGTDAYPEPMVDHVKARERVLKVYQKALNKM